MNRLFLLCLLLLALPGCGSKPEPTAAPSTTVPSVSLSPEAAKFPEFLGLDASKGLDVIVWQISPELLQFGLLEHADPPREPYCSELLSFKLQGATAEQMREILATYSVSESDVTIIPWEHPLSSYLPDYCLDDGSGDAEAKTQAYIEEVRALLFG